MEIVPQTQVSAVLATGLFANQLLAKSDNATLPLEPALLLILFLVVVSTILNVYKLETKCV
jgi:hypothetical protein